MLVSEVKRWQYFISWDNAVPANSSAMLKSLRLLGSVSKLSTKTSVALSPRSTVTWSHVRSAIRLNLNRKNGSAFYVNLRSGKAFQISRRTQWMWKAAP